MPVDAIIVKIGSSHASAEEGYKAVGLFELRLFASLPSTTVTGACAAIPASGV